MEKGSLVIQYQIDGDLVSKEEFEKRRKSKNAEKSNAAASKEKSKFKNKHRKIKNNLKSNDVAVFKEKSKSNVAVDASKEKDKQVDAVKTQQQENRSLEISYMKNGKFFSKEDFKGNNKIKENIQGNNSVVDDHHHHKIEDSKQGDLEKKIAELEKQLRNKEKQNETLEHHLYIQLKENKTVQLKLDQSQVLNESLKESIHQKDLKIEALNGHVESIRNTKLTFKKKVKGLRRTIDFQKEKLDSKESTIVKLSKKLIEVQASEKDVSHPLKDVLVTKDEATKISVKDNSNVDKAEVKSLKNLDPNIQAQDNKIKEIDCEIVRCNSTRVCKCKTVGLQNNSRLNSLEMAINDLKDQLCIQSNELAQLRCSVSNNTGKKP